MDRAAVAAVEAVKPMGLDPSVGALLLGQSDAGDGTAERIAEHAEQAGATYVARTDDPDEGELLMAARRMAIPCVERLGAVLIEDVGVPIPQIPALLASVAAVAEAHDTAIPVIGHAGDGNFHPLVTFDPHDTMPRPGPRRPSARSWTPRSSSVAPSPVSTAWGRSRSTTWPASSAPTWSTWAGG
jgi:glycolate oxidase